MKSLFNRLAGVAVVGVVLYSCASIGRPEGGAIDETPPRFVGSTPAPGALNNNRKKVTIEFDEFIKLDETRGALTTASSWLYALFMIYVISIRPKIAHKYGSLEFIAEVRSARRQTYCLKMGVHTFLLSPCDHLLHPLVRSFHGLQAGAGRSE